MNRPIRRLAVACFLMLAALLANATYVQYWQAEDLNNTSGNRRVLDEQFSIERGPILVNGEEIVRSMGVDTQFQYLRTYEQAEAYAHLTGFYSFEYGTRAVERSQNAILSGTSDQLFVRRVIDLVTNEPPRGGSVQLTIDPAAQQAAVEGLGDRVGAVVAIDPQTGAILAMHSTPSYDPNVLAAHDLGSVREAWTALNENPAQPLLNRAVQSTFPPGSTFKLVTTAAALSNSYTPESRVQAPATYTLPNTSTDLPNFDSQPCGPNDETTLLNALRISCNTAFAILPSELPDGALAEQAARFGFGEEIEGLGLPEAAASQFCEDPDDAQLALCAIGQFDVRATPLQMAMVVAGIANSGSVMRPYVVSELRGPDTDLLERTEPEELSQAVTPEVAADLTEMMVEVVQSGTGQPAAIDGVQVGGKTGTAQRGDDLLPVAWFVSFAPADDPQVAVAVVIEDAGVERDQISGGGLAAPIAQAVMEAVVQ